MFESLKNKVSGMSEGVERWFGAYMALNVKGLFPWDEKVGNTCDLIIKAAWNGDMGVARKWAQNLNQYIVSKKEEDDRYESLDEGQVGSWFENFKDLWGWGGEEVIRERVREETDIELEETEGGEN